MKRLNLKDLARMAIKQTPNKCNVSRGDLVRIKCCVEEYEFLGIVTEAYNDKMCVLIGLKEIWWSTHVNCEILSYNKKYL